jgi:hypothetical protein
MSTVNAELALAAARVRALAESLPESRQPDIAREWGSLLEQVDECMSDGVKIATIIEWRRAFENSMSAKSHASLLLGAGQSDSTRAIRSSMV